MSPPSTGSGSAARPKRTVSPWPPRWLTPVPPRDRARGDGQDYAEFLETNCRVTKDSFAAKAGTLLVIRPWTRQLLGHLLARRPDGRLRHREALIGVARKNVKSTTGAGLSLGHLILGPAGGEVYAAAGDKEQARIVFGTAKRMVELDPELSQLLTCYRDAIEFRETGSVYRVLSAEAYSKEGLNPSLVVFDEVHVQPNTELWDVLALASGARVDPLMVGITTAGVRTDQTGSDSLCYSKYQYGRRVITGEVDDPTFFMAWWEPKNPDADHRLEATWREANPGFGDLIDPEDFVSAVKKTRENEFRTKRCNQWVGSARAWFPVGEWDRRATGQPVPDLAEAVLGFDGSFNGDSTGIIVASCGPHPHVDVVACWEKPADADDSWRVPIIEVEDEIRAACKRWQVREVVCDPFRWARSLQLLEAEGLPMVEFPQSPSRMTPATTSFYEAFMNDAATHSGDPRLARHVNNAVLKVDSRGTRLSKETKGSPRKIDLAVAAVMAVARAVVAEEPAQPFFAARR